MEETNQSRRTFLFALTLLFGTVCGLWRYLTPNVVPKRAVLAKAAKVEIPNNGALIFRDARVAIMRGSADIYAVSLVCTHLGCTLNATQAGFSCPCHGSRFDVYGTVVSGPADRPLRRLEVFEKDGNIEVYKA